VITFSGNRGGMSDEEGARNTILGLNRVKKIAEDHGVTICMELLNSKVDHHDYMCDHSAWGVQVVQTVNSPRVKLLYDIYHMQIMEGDLVRTIQKNIDWIAHFHTGGVPGRHELDATQEVQWDGVMRGIAAATFHGYVAHEFVPIHDPLTSLRQAVDLCDV
jgi:hydroxypyruvate isomerase